MQKKFKSKKRKKYKFKYILFFICFTISFYKTYTYIYFSNIKLNDKYIAKYLIDNSNKHIISDNNLINNIKKIVFSSSNLTNSNYHGLIKLDTKINKEYKPINSYKPLIYIYNTHQKEEYSSSNLAQYSITPTVMLADYILEEELNKYNYQTLVEERDIKSLLNQNKWKYADSYKASRIYLDENKLLYPSLKYFIDIHRDSTSYDKTTITIDNINYARILFIVGIENKNWEANYNFTKALADKINLKYPNLCKGIYKKGGSGVNGIYNQDNNSYTILVEIGGIDNKIEEVYNTTKALSIGIKEIIDEQI